MESELTTEELIELIGVTTANVNSQFELWLTVTFAVIIASHLAVHQLPKNFRHLVAVLYTSVSILLFLMLLSAIGLAQEIAGWDTMEFYSGEPIRLAIAILRIGIWVLGTLATLMFIYKGYTHTDDT